MRKPRVAFAMSWVVSIPFDLLRTTAVSYDHHGLDGHDGIDLLTRERGYPEGCLLDPAAHLEALRSRGLVGRGLVITQTQRNAFQNPRSPLFSEITGVCESRKEKCHESRRPYFGIAHMDDGTLRGLTMDFRRPPPAGVRFWVPGIPVLRNGRVLTAREMAPEVGDFRHLWRLEVSVRGPRRDEDVRTYRRLAEVFERHRHAAAEAAAAALERAAEGLEREVDYLHNALGVGDRHLVLVVANGPLELLGELALANGARSACVVDNGGSCQIGIARPGKPLRPVIESPTFREPTIAMAAYELAVESADALPFAGACGPAFGAPGTPPRTHVSRVRTQGADAHRADVRNDDERT